MRFGFKQPLVGEKRCVTTPITAAEETNTKLIVNLKLRISAASGCGAYSRAALINFLSQMRRLFEGGAYSSKYGIYGIQIRYFW